MLAGSNPRNVVSKDGLLDDLRKALSLRIPNAELDEHLDEDPNDGRTDLSNGNSKKSVLSLATQSTLSGGLFFRRPTMQLAGSTNRSPGDRPSKASETQLNIMTEAFVRCGSRDRRPPAYSMRSASTSARRSSPSSP